MLTETQDRPRDRSLSQTLGHCFGVLSLLGCVWPWVEMAYDRWNRIHLKDCVDGSAFVMAGCLVLAIIAARLHSKLWRIAVPLSILMLALELWTGGPC